MRKVGSIEEFYIDWVPTWMPGSDLGGAREFVDEFKVQLSVRHRKKKGQSKTDIAGKIQPKKQQGRPRKRL
jgi:hypothetical protein